MKCRKRHFDSSWSWQCTAASGVNVLRSPSLLVTTHFHTCKSLPLLTFLMICLHLKKSNHFLIHVPFFHSSSPASHQVRLGVSARCRGDLSVSLESPGGTVSMLLDSRPNDASTAGLKNWTLMTVHCWGEQPRGHWTLKVWGCFA